MMHNALRVITIPVKILSSKTCLLWLTCAWVIYYVSTAIWIDEAFAFFVYGVRNNIFILIPFLLFLVSGYLNLLRALKGRGKRDKTGYLAWFMCSLGTMLYLTGFFLSIQMRQYDNRLVGASHSLDLPWIKETYYISVVDPGLKETFRMSDQDGVLAYEPNVTMTDTSGKAYTIGAYPPVRIDGTYFHVLNYGLAPGIRLYVRDILVDEGYMPLRILPPGRSDFFEISPQPFRFLISLAPEQKGHGGHHSEPVFNLRTPLLHARVFSGESIIAEGNSREGVSFNGYELTFYEPTFWVQLESAKDPGMPVMRFGIFILLFGALLYILRIVLKTFFFLRRL